MKPKPDKVEEPTAPCLTKQGLKATASKESGSKQVDMEVVRKNNARLMQIHRKVLHKLAQ